MLKKENRLTKKKDFDQVFEKGKSSFNKLLGIKAVNNESSFSRFGIIVSTKISKKAVERNKIKRRIRNILQKELENIRIGKDVVIITLPEIKNKEYQEIEGALKISLKKLKLL